MRSRLGFGSICVLALSFASTSPKLAAETNPPAESGVQESVDVRLVQTDVTVIDRKSGDSRLVTGLKREQFLLRLDGQPLTAEQQQRLTFDEVCSTPEQPAPILAVVDFNYLDAKSRMAVADELDALAATALDSGTVYKVYALTRQTRLLTPGFTRDPEQLRAAAQKIRETNWLTVASDANKSGVQVSSTNSEFSRLDPTQLKNSLGPRGWKASSTFPELQPADKRQRADIKNRTASEPFTNLDPGYNEEGSLAALEAIMRAHQWMKMRKTLTLFSSNAFQIRRKDRYEEITRPLRDIMQSGFSVWTVDVPAGWGMRTGAPSDLLTMLAKESGGEFLVGTSQSFKRPVKQAACAYEFSLAISDPPEKHVEYNLVIALDTKQDKRLFDYDIIASDRAIAWSREETDRARRLSALLSPDDFSTPPVAVQIGFPVLLQDKELLPTRVRVALSRLTWLPDTDGSYKARVSLDAVVQRETEYGLTTICGTASEQDGPIALTLPRPPKNDDGAGLSLEIYCAVQRDGLHTARAVVNDLNGDQSGAGRSSLLFDRTGTPDWQVSGARMTASSGRDFVWRPKLKAAVRDTERLSARDIDSTHSADPSDQLTLEYVLCGPARELAQQTLQHAVATVDEVGERRVMQVLGSSALQLDVTDAKGPFCSRARVVLPSDSLDPGHYEFTVTSKGEDHPLAAVPFDVL